MVLDQTDLANPLKPLNDYINKKIKDGNIKLQQKLKKRKTFKLFGQRRNPEVKANKEWYQFKRVRFDSSTTASNALSKKKKKKKKKKKEKKATAAPYNPNSPAPPKQKSKKSKKKGTGSHGGSKGTKTNKKALQGAKGYIEARPERAWPGPIVTSLTIPKPTRRMCMDLFQTPCSHFGKMLKTGSDILMSRNLRHVPPT